MILTKDNLSKKSNNKKNNRNSKNLRQDNKKTNNKYENKYFNKKIKNDNSSSIKDVLNDKIFSKNYGHINDQKLENKNVYISNISDNNSKKININSDRTKNKNIKNPTKDVNNIKEIITDFGISNKAIYDNIYNNIKKENKKIKQKNISMEQRYQKNDEELFLSENMEETNKNNQIYSRPYGHNSPRAQLKKNFGNQFNIKDAKNILNINYFYDKSHDNFENPNDIFYSSHYKSKFQKKVKAPDSRNRYNSLVINDQMNGYAIQAKTINSFYIRKNPINLVKHINNYFIKDEEISNKENSNSNHKKYIETEEINYGLKNNRFRYHSMVERNNDFNTPDRFYTNTINNYINNKYGQNDKKVIRRNGNKIQILKKNNNTSIQEYKLSLGDEDESENDLESYENDNITSTSRNRNFYKKNSNDNNQGLNYIKKYHEYFTKNIRPMKSSQFEIKNNKPRINLPMKNYINVNKAHNNSFQKRNIIPNKKGINNKVYERNKTLTGTPNLSESMKNQKNNDIKIKHKHKSQEFDETIGTKLQHRILFNNESFKISKNENVEIISKENNKNKLVFNSEDELIEYIYNKFEEKRKKKNYFNRKLRFTGFVLTKKYKGKNICDIRIEDNIDQINQQLKDENILINDKRVGFKFIEELNNINILEEENKKLKDENEKLNKKDIIKNELIKKLDNEKLNLNEEIIKLKKEIELLKEKQK